MSNTAISQFLTLITSGDLSQTDIEFLASEQVPPRDRNLLQKVIVSLVDDNICYSLDPRGQFIRASSPLCSARISIDLDDAQKLKRIEIVPNQYDYMSLADLAKALEERGFKYQLISIEDSCEIFLKNSDPIAVSSLSKLYICEIAFRAIDENLVKWSDQIQLDSNDLRRRSAGLGEKDVGSFLSVRDLVTYTLLASDNTASDLLLKVLRSAITRESNIFPDLDGIQTTLETYGRNLKGPDYRQLEVLWDIGKDYFFSLERISQSMLYICNSEWTPWDDLPANRGNYIYKGGQAPGVLSGMWAVREERKETLPTRGLFGYTINIAHPLTYIDEIWATAAASTMFLKNRSVKGRLESNDFRAR